VSSQVFDTIYGIVRTIPTGAVATYGQIAKLAGLPRGARIVGYAMSSCRLNDVPCHRVVDRSGCTKAAFDTYAPGTQQLLLESEGVSFLAPGIVDLAHHLWPGPLV